MDRLRPDVLAVGGLDQAADVAGQVPLVISGDVHERTERVEGDTRFLTVGSTGATGLGSFTADAGNRYEAELLRFRGGRLVGSRLHLDGRGIGCVHDRPDRLPAGDKCRFGVEVTQAGQRRPRTVSSRRRRKRSRRHLRTHRGDSGERGPRVALIVDAGPLYAYVDRDDRHHDTCLELLETHPGPLVVPMLVITEVTYLLATRLGVEPEVRFLGDLAAGNLIPEPAAAGDWLRIAELVARYRDLPLGTVDASVIAAAERLSITEVATLDRRHFSVVQPAAGAFQLLP